MPTIVASHPHFLRQLSKEEMMNMVKFGADQIFKGKGSTISDAGIPDLRLLLLAFIPHL